MASTMFRGRRLRSVGLIYVRGVMFIFRYAFLIRRGELRHLVYEMDRDDNLVGIQLL